MGRPDIIGVCAALIACLALSPVAAASDTASAEFDLVEMHLGKGSDHLVIESSFAFGGGADQFALKFDTGSDTRVGFDDVQVQALYSRKLSDSATLLVGGRRDFRDGADLSYAALGMELALAPWLDAEHYAYLSQHGHFSGSAKLTARWAVAPRLALEPRVTLGWSGADVPAEALGAGLSDLEGAIRLRRAVGSHADVYLGYVHERLLGRTRRIAIDAGDELQVNRAIIGMGLRF